MYFFKIESRHQKNTKTQTRHFTVIPVPVETYLYNNTIDQFSILDLNKTRILGYYGQGTNFFDREILDGIGTKPGGAYHHSVGSHRRVLCQSRQILHVAPSVPLRQNMLVEEFLNLNFFLWAN